MKSLAYPDWVLRIVRPGEVLADRELMRSAIRVTLASLRETEGGPFGAIVATEEGRVVSIGYNLVVPSRDSTAHGEIVAIRRAEEALGTYRLRGAGVPRLQLLTTCEPCIMCTGAIHWAGVPLVVAAARAADAEAAGFIEGPRSFEASEFLRERGIEYRSDLLREEALELFRAYRGEIYNG